MWRATIFLVCLSAHSGDVSAQEQLQKLLADDTPQDRQFGVAVTIGVGLVVVGAWQDAELGVDAGAVHVFRQSGSSWTPEAKLLADDGASEARFGLSVAVDGDSIIVGAPGDDEAAVNAGAAYIFVYDGVSWSQEAKLIPEVATGGEACGGTGGVDLQDGRAIVGARGDSEVGNQTGAGYVFELQGGDWTQTAKLIASDAEPFDQLGAVALSGDAVLLGARLGSSSAVADCGAAYVFRLTGSEWIEEAKLIPDSAEPNDQFGHAVALVGDTALVGAHGDDSGGYGAGAAYVFENDGSSWSQSQKLLALDASSPDSFGASVSLDGSRAVVGARLRNGSVGAAYLFADGAEGWNEVTQYVSLDGDPGDNFGVSVAIRGGIVLVGAFLDDESAENGGAAYVFSLGSDTLRAEDIVAAPGESDVSHFVLATHTLDLTGFSFGLAFDPTQLNVSAVTLDDTLPGSLGAEFFAPQIDNGAGWYTVGVVQNVSAPLDGLIPSGVGQPFVQAVFDVSPASVIGTSTLLELPAVVGDPPVPALFVLDDASEVTPVLEGGKVLFLAEGSFVRGDVNGSQVVNLADPILLLQFLFVPGTGLSCVDAGDANDDGSVGLTDVFLLLDHLFEPGAPTPASPFPDCGIDGTADGLSCEMSTCP